MIDIRNNEITEYPKALLVAVDDGAGSDFEYMMDEMKSLIEACEMEVAEVVIQHLKNPDPATYIGSGKLNEIAETAAAFNIDYCIFSDTLSPAQLKNITAATPCVVMDRTGLILEIFSKRAGTREARLQVECANLQYMLPRLIGMRTSLGRQGGASGSMSNKGQGEKQLELDRRHIEKRISELERELKTIEHDRNTQRGARKKSNIPVVALAGYTNAGKSTLMNRLVSMSGGDDEKKVFEKDMLFATLDTTVRRISTGDNRDFLLADTVGFVSNLPHGLIKAFRSTLEEVRLADLILIVLDASDEHIAEQLDVTEDTLKELGCKDQERIYVLNKSDLGTNISLFRRRDIKSVKISALNGDGVEELLSEVRDIIFRGEKTLSLLIPFSLGSTLSLINDNAKVLETDYLPEGTKIKALCPEWLASKVEEFVIPD